MHFAGSGGNRKDGVIPRNGKSNHRKVPKHIESDDDDTREASRPLMKKKKKVDVVTRSKKSCSNNLS